MLTILIIFLVLAFAALTFSGIQDKLPSELSFLKGTPASENVALNGTNYRTFNYEGWSVKQAGETIEIVKQLTEPVESNGNVLSNPELGIMCNKGHLDLRIDTRMAVTGTAETRVTVGNEKPTAWTKGTGRNIFPSDPSATLRELLQADSPVNITISYVDLGKRTLVFNPQGIRPLVDQFNRNCR